MAEKSKSIYFPGAKIVVSAEKALDKTMREAFEGVRIPAVERRAYRDIAHEGSLLITHVIQETLRRARELHPRDQGDAEVIVRLDDMFDVLADSCGAQLTAMLGLQRLREQQVDVVELSLQKGFEATLEHIVPDEGDRKRLLDGYDFRARIYDGGRYQANLHTGDRIATITPGIELAQYKDPEARTGEGSIGLAV